MGAQEEEPHRAIEDSLILIFTALFYLIRLFCECFAKLLATLHSLFFFLIKKNQEIFPFFQRGAGKSTPHACLVENTTWDLIDDIEKLREHLEIPEWQVKYFTFGFYLKQILEFLVNVTC
jgi:hypothetical protein